jgi:purine-binding chemotaxis protein CheW
MNSPDSIASGSGAQTRQILTFRLGEETFGIDILRVKEIRGWSPVTRVPQSPPQVLGVLNLRGAIVPIIDLRVRFALPSADFTPVTVIIVISVKMADGSIKECGLVVDSVSDVVDLTDDMMREAPQLSGAASVEYIESLATVDEGMLILLDADALVRGEMEIAAGERTVAA